MKQVEMEGESIDEAIEKALGLLDVDRDKVSVDIMTEPKKGLLGFGRQNARVRVVLRESVVAKTTTAPESEPTSRPTSSAGEALDAAAPVTEDEPIISDERYAAVATTSQEIIQEILTLMGVSAEVESKQGHDASEVVLDIKGESSGLLIGRRGQTLEALQYLLSRIVAGKLGPEGPQPIVDTENYRLRRVRTLEDMALRMGEKAKRSRRTMGIDALSARDRRIVHLTLQDDPWLTTKSLGNGPYRRLLIIPEGDRKEPGAEDSRE